MSETRKRRPYHNCAAHERKCPVHDHPETPTACTCPVYAHPQCIFKYCPEPDFCKIPGVGCKNWQNKDDALKRVAEDEAEEVQLLRYGDWPKSPSGLSGCESRTVPR